MAFRSASAKVLLPRRSHLHLRLRLLFIDACSARISRALRLRRIELRLDSCKLPEAELLGVIGELLREWIVVGKTLRLLRLESAHVLRSFLRAEDLVVGPRRW